MTQVKELRGRRQRNIFASVIAARTRHRPWQSGQHQFHLGDFDRHIFRQIVDVFPGERIRKFRFKLVTQWDGIVTVAQNEMFANLEVNESLND